MEQKVAFIHEWLSQKFFFSSLCKAYGISRQTGYNLIKKYEKFGIDGLDDLRSTPLHNPNITSPQFVEAIKDLRIKKDWGARKLAVKLKELFPNQHIPSIVTINNVLRREGLIQRRKWRRPVTPLSSLFDPKKCNEVWSADYKGKFRMGNNRYCHTLTIADSFSRFIFAAKGMYFERFESAKPVFTRVFREFGIPLQLHTDNGQPFASIQSVRRFGQFSYWLIDLGIQPVFSDPGKPQQNGRHERMHRDLKAKCTKPPAFNLNAQQKKLNYFITEYNFERPHEALNMKTPNDVHKTSLRPFPEKIKPPEYDSNMLVKRVTKNGAIRWGAYEFVKMSSCLAGRYIALEKIGNRVWKVFYRNTRLGFFYEDDKIVYGKYYKLHHEKV